MLSISSSTSVSCTSTPFCRSSTTNCPYTKNLLCLSQPYGLPIMEKSRCKPFTSWPPEIRNAIYEELFEFGVIITIDRGREPSFGSLSGVSLLATCRQIQTEAIRILYSRNVFKCDYTGKRDCTRIFWNWLRGVGHNRDILRKVVIVLREFHRSSSKIDVHAIFEELWRQPGNKTEFCFVYKSPEDPLGATSPATVLNRMLAAMRPENSPQLRVFARSRRMLNTVRLSQNGSHVYFGLVTNLIELATVNYELSTTGQLLRHEAQNRAATLLE
jgi:hypothetical protein